MATPASPRLVVTVCDAAGHPVRAPGLAAWLAGVAPAGASGRVTVALVSDRRIRSLNRTYRGADYATDVLSFPAGVPSRRAPAVLGDIVIARGVAARQALAAGHSTLTEVKILALHGLLHLLGYDHERDNGRMRRVEARLRRKGGLAEGLIERAASPTPRRPARP
jgi:probable rRNA maturation factor